MSDRNAEVGMRKSELSDIAVTDFPAMPTETEIYILPSGEIVVADLPQELARMIANLQNLPLPDNDS